ncbi:hypothetical protein SNOG_01826 [Parastagonospora nodorum SN15]|uniref:Uncharacterized protein n=1 Tax=Phaeosphaeria nodorum (strain SN15 / ATCC MYA-4574 / FGSC 10173) TaxID=321614 RepID=Q0V2D8_PHANO|nr:hypothetical protein SNOG_01826 [Parastagonospora nodorum SN15]EAT91475.1 hypothetical protein SNOG_01826 [Parastagonospora nodorum SN15]
MGGLDAVPISKASCTDVGRAGKRGCMDDMQVAADVSRVTYGTTTGLHLIAAKNMCRMSITNSSASERHQTSRTKEQNVQAKIQSLMIFVPRASR